MNDSEEEKVLSEFANSTFMVMMTSEKDSAELASSISAFVSLFGQYPSLKFNRVTQYCCQFADAKFQEDPDKFTTKSTMIPLRLTQFMKNYLTKRKEYTEEFIREHVPGFLDTFLIQQENKEKKKKKMEQQQQQQQQQQQTQETVLQDELADAFGNNDFLEDDILDDPVLLTNTNPNTTVNKKKRNKSAEESLTTSKKRAKRDVNIGAGALSDDDFMHSESMVSTMETLIQQSANTQDDNNNNNVLCEA